MARATVEVVYAGADGEDAAQVVLEPGATLRDIIVASGVLSRHPQIDLEKGAIGVFGRVRAPDALARPGDRIEIYRSLKNDPIEARRRRARKGRR